MEVKKVYLGTWFARTSLHLREIYDFFKYQQGVAGLDQPQLKTLWQQLQVEEVIFWQDAEHEIIKAVAHGIEVSITEEGIILLSLPIYNLNGAIEQLTNFYHQRFSPAIDYLFSRGAQLPKQLAGIKEKPQLVFLTTEEPTEAKAKSFFTTIGEKCISQITCTSSAIFFAVDSSLIWLKQLQQFNSTLTEEIIRNIILAKGFERQLQSYLSLHRSSWETINQIRESKSIRYRDFPHVRYTLLELLKTLSFVQARLEQMNDVLSAHQSEMDTKLKQELAKLMLNRFERLQADQKYISHLWQMTIEYAQESLSLLESLFAENTQRELNALKFITLIAAIAGFFGMNIPFPWEERWSATFPSAIAVTFIIAAVLVLFNYCLELLVYNRRFMIKGK